MNKFLFKHIDNSGLALFRVVFGFLIAMEAFGAILTGWVQRTLVEPDFTFNFIGFDFLQYLQGPQLYVYFVVMGIFGVFVMLGFKYRVSMLLYALMWTAVYLLQKSSYNNHYYLMMLLCWIMAFLPANRWYSLDARINPEIKSGSMPQWVLLVLILQVWIVYTYASIAKFYPGWLDGSMAALLMRGKRDYWLVGDLLQQSWVHWAITYTGILFDLLIVPLLLWRRTRLAAFIIGIFFHLFNSIIFQIGIFPYMSIAFALFFFSPEILNRRFFPDKKVYIAGEVIVPKHKNVLIIGFSIYFIFQIGLPSRHWFFKDDVLWTEEGHRLSWRMMLRSRSGTLQIYIADKDTGIREKYEHTALLGYKQQGAVKSKPDMMWQLAQRIKKLEQEKGRDVGVYFDSFLSINGSEYSRFIDPDVDLAAEKWYPFKHHEWILPSPKMRSESLLNY